MCEIWQKPNFACPRAQARGHKLVRCGALASVPAQAGHILCAPPRGGLPRADPCSRARMIARDSRRESASCDASRGSDREAIAN